MKKSKKALIILIVTVVAVLVVGTVTTTYAWFLSRYTKEYDFVLQAESPIIIKYESDLVFHTGDRETAGNTLIPAKAKQTVAIDQQALAAIDVFDVNVAEPPHTGKVASAAHPVKFSASGAYWTGEEPTIGLFAPELYAYTSAFMEGSELSARLSALSVEQASLTEDNLTAVLAAEKSAYSATERLIARNDLVTRGEVGFLVILSYLDTTILYYDGVFYKTTALPEEAVFVLPAAVESESELRYWVPLTAEDTYPSPNGTEAILGEKEDRAYLRMLPNTTFSFDLYVFIAKTDEELDPQINGESLSLFASLTIREETQGGND